MIASGAPPLEVKYHRLEVQNHWLLGIGAIILAALIALGGWVAVDRFALTGNASRADTWISAITGDDFAQYRALYATNAQVLSPETSGVVWRYDKLGDIFAQMNGSGLTVERTGSVESSGPFVTFPISWSNDLGYEGTGVTTLQYNDAGLILAQTTYIDY